MDIDLIVQKLNQAASSGMLSNELTEVLDEAAKTIIYRTQSKEAEVEPEGGGTFWFHVCGECRTAINRWDKYCHECGRRLIWK